MNIYKNFTFYIYGKDELKYLSDKNINYFIGFNHPGWVNKYSEEEVFFMLDI
jgi:hypothetical protein